MTFHWPYLPRFFFLSWDSRRLIHRISNGRNHTGESNQTSSGLPYIGRTKQVSPAKRGQGAKDGRNREGNTKVVDKYDPSKPGHGAYKEQKAIDKRGGVTKLDNKRNEASAKRMKELEKKYGKGK